MDEQAQIMAVKKACAEIIFNINKEAAARVVVSEQKAVALQKDLDFTKQEALRMLLRVKQMSDATTSEAEITSLNQSRRIAELEAQLNETEEMILDIRAEISLAHDQLDTVKSSNVHSSSFNEKDDVICCDIVANVDQQITSPLTSPQFNKCHNRTKQAPKDIAQVGNFFDYDPNLSSVMLESKETQLYRNGCRQRIRAFERNLLDEKLLYGNLANQPMPIKSDTFDNEHEHNVETCALFSSNRDLDAIKNPVRLVKFPDHSPTVQYQPVKSCILQRKKSQNGKAKATLNSLDGNKDPKIQQQSSDASHQKNNSMLGNEYESFGLDLPQNKPEKMKLVENFSMLDQKIQCDNYQSLFVARGSIRKRKARYQDDDIDPSSVPPFLSCCKMNSIKHDSTSDFYCLGTESKAEINEYTNTVLASRHVTAVVKMDSDPRFGHNAEGKDDAFIEASEVVKHYSNATKSIKVANEFSTVSNSLNAKTEDPTNGTASHVDRSSVLHEFSRKHKKKTAINLVDCSSPEGQTKEEEKVDIMESAGESKGLSQVARQLISLSGKRW